MSRFVHGSAAPRWQDVEAPLFAVRAMGSKVDDSESVIMPQIMGLLERLPKHPKIQYCATLVIARYASWTRFHPEFIPYQLHLISAGFEHDDVVAASAHALKYLCQECSEVRFVFCNLH
jgi:transportin-3